MATTRSKKSGDSKPVEKKQVEAPKAKEVKEAPKPVEKKAAAPRPAQKDEYDALRESLRLRFKGRLSEEQIEHRVNAQKNSKGEK